MLQNYNNRQTWPIIYTTIICAISLVIASPLFFILAFFPLILLRREWVVPMLLLPSLIGGAINTEESIIPLGILSVMFLSPVLLIDSLKYNNKIQWKYSRYFYLFALFVVLGFVVHNFRFGFDTTIIQETVTNLIRLSFFLLLFKFLINKRKEYLKQSLLCLVYSVIPIILCVVLYAFTIGKELKMANSAEIMLFGGAKHGEFTGILTAFSICVFYWGRKKGNNLYRLIFAILVLVAAFYLILNMGSKNGLLSFALMIIGGLFFFIQSQSNIKKVLIFIFGILAILISMSFYSEEILNSPTIERLDTQYEKRGVEGVSTSRLDVWRAGFKAMQDAPLLGWGGSGEKIALVSVKYGGPRNVMHNTFMQVWVRYGSLALILFISFIWLLYKRGKNIYQYCKVNGDYIWFIPVFSFFMLLFSGMFISWFWQTLLWYNAVFILAITTKLKYH